MRYFELSQETDPKVVGVTNGTGQLNGSSIYNNTNHWYRNIFHTQPMIDNKTAWKKWVHYEDYAATALEGIVLEKKGKLTDYMKFNLRGFYVSSKLKALLETAYLPPHVFHPTIITSLKTGQPIDGFYWFAFDMDTGEETVDFAKSEFDYAALEEEFKIKITINNYEDYLRAFYITGKANIPTKLVFNKNFKGYDVFGTQFLSPKTYISDRLLEKWQGANITGYIARSQEEVRVRAERFNDKYTKLIFE